jgi:hypothetical protein
MYPASPPPKIHTCPNCTCSSLLSRHHPLPSPIPISSPRIHVPRVASPGRCKFVYPEATLRIQDKLFVKERTTLCQPITGNNIYYRKLERSHSQKSRGSNCSYASHSKNEAKDIKGVGSPKKAVNVSFRYMSPPKSQPSSNMQK